MNYYLESLKSQDRDLLEAKTQKIRELATRTAESAYEIGKELLQVKTILGHGNFLAWLADKFEWSEWTARNFMNVALKMEKPVQNGKLSLYAPSALYLLASNSTPEEARKEAEKLTTEGKKITYSVAEELKEKHTATEAAWEELTQEQQERLSEKIVAPSPDTTDYRKERDSHLRGAIKAAKNIRRPSTRDQEVLALLEKAMEARKSVVA